MACNCKVGTDLAPEAVTWLEGEMARNRPYRALCAEAEERFGVKLFPRTLTTHKQQHMGAAADAKNEWREKVDVVREELERQMDGASVLIKPLYMVALRNMDALEDTKPSQEALIKSIQALTAITGNATDRDALIAYAIKSSQREA